MSRYVPIRAREIHPLRPFNKVMLLFETPTVQGVVSKDRTRSEALSELIMLMESAQSAYIIFYTQHGIKFIHPKFEHSLRKHIANALFEESATNQQKLAMAHIDCSHCAMPHCSCRQDKYRGELRAVVSSEDLRNVIEATKGYDPCLCDAPLDD